MELLLDQTKQFWRTWLDGSTYLALISTAVNLDYQLDHGAGSLRYSPPLVPGGRLMNGESIELERQLAAPPERVWAALVDPSQAGTWFAASATIVPELGGAYELFWLPDDLHHQSTIGCRITAIAPPRYLAFTWRGPDVLSDLMNEGDPPPPPTHVTFSLRPADGTTALRVRHTGFGPGGDWARARAWHERAWTTILDNLEALLAGRPLPRPWTE